MVMKSQIILYIYDQLINHRVVSTNEIVEHYMISIRTFRRYISEINAFLFNNFKNQEVVYDHFKKTFMIKDTANKL